MEIAAQRDAGAREAQPENGMLGRDGRSQRGALGQRKVNRGGNPDSYLERRYGLGKLVD